VSTGVAPRIVLDQESGPGFTAERKQQLLRTLLGHGYAVTLSGSGVAPLDGAPLLVLAEAEPARDRDGEEAASGVPVRYRGVAGLAPEAVLELVRREAAGSPEPGGWQPWFPVIDYDRCTNCMQCLSFCLFGVYDVDAHRRIDVAQPERCKTHCPACSRVCPEVAILFPKYKNGPINGDLVKGEDIEREKMKTDISSLLGGDIYALLRQRHERASSRFSKERDEERALKERQRCLAKLQEQLDIPDEVLRELPTADAIRARAAERIAARRGGDTDPSPSTADTPKSP
jgi:Pyruvate/2-oxoacid:ferredoxin oxidoreductase delta subunit